MNKVCLNVVSPLKHLFLVHLVTQTKNKLKIWRSFPLYPYINKFVRHQLYSNNAIIIY